jgi:PAS domain S-box-containing protein
MRQRDRGSQPLLDAPELLRAVTELAPDVVTLLDGDLIIRYVSPAVATVAGYRPEELVGKDASQLVHPDDLASVRETDREVLRTRDVVTSTLRFRRKGGHWITLESRLRNYLDCPELKAVLVFSRDVSRTKELTETLLRTAEEAEDLFQNAPCGYHAADPRGTLTRINATELGWLRYARDELVGKEAFRELLTAESRPGYDEQAEKLAQDESIHNVEVEVVRKDRSSFPALLCSMAVFGGASRPREIRTTTFDISERKRSEVALTNMNRALRVLSETRHELIRAESEIDLLATVCRTLVDVGGYRAAFVHYVQSDPGTTMKIVAKAHFADRNFVDSTLARTPHNAYAHALIRTTVRSGKPQVSQELLRDPAVSPWRTLFERSGFQAAAAVPLQDQGGVFATLLVFAGEPRAFGAEEIELLCELGDDLSFGIKSLLAKASSDALAVPSGSNSDASDSVLSKLSRREREVLFLVLEGRSSKEIAAILGVSAASVDTYRSRLMFKLEVTDTLSLVRLAIRAGVIDA